MASSTDEIKKIVRRWPLAGVAIRASIDGDQPRTRDEARKCLAEASPNELMKVVFDPRWPWARFGSFWPFLRRTCKTRWQLFHWVYADEPEKLQQVYEDRSWQTLRIQSESLYKLVQLLLGEVQHRHPGLKRATLFGYAYGQPRHHPGRVESGNSSYKKKVILTGGKKRRTLYVPTPALARVQKALLRLVLNPAQENLPDCMMGGRPRPVGSPQPYGIFRNAAAHLGQNYLVSFDIKDFFPTIRTDDIINALSGLRDSTIVGSDSEPLPWTHDLIVFIAKLVTFQGRLPQGAPTSPAIANLVFSQYDRRIRDRLGKLFVYTRYFDDLTISLAEKDAKAAGLQTAAAVRDHVEEIIRDVLNKTRFRLNTKKTRATNLAKGTFVTGLHLSPTAVTVPRKTRRAVRALLYRIRSKKIGFVATATGWYRTADFFQTEFNPQRNHHKHSSRRLSMEAMAIMAVRGLCGTIRIEKPETTRYNRGLRTLQPAEFREGKAALRDATYLLTRLWQQHLRVDSDAGHVLFHDADGLLVARLRCDRNDGLFLLDKKEAFACIELWHHLTGIWSGFNPHSPERCFQGVREFRNQIRETLDRVHIGRPALASPPPIAPPSGEAITIETGSEADVRRLGPKLFNLTDQWRQLIGGAGASQVNVPELGATFCHPVDSPESFAEWLTAFRQVAAARCAKLPAELTHGTSLDRLLVVLHDRVQGKRHAGYECEKKLISDAYRTAGRNSRYDGDVSKIPLDVLQCLQVKLLKIFEDALSRSLEHRRLRGVAAWQTELRAAQFEDITPQRVKSLIERLMKAVKDARWKTTSAPVFMESGRSDLANNIHAVLQKPVAQGEWSQVLAFGKALFGHLLEHMEGNCSTLSPELQKKVCGDEHQADGAQDPIVEENGDHWALREELIRQLGQKASIVQLIQCLRNREAHKNEKRAVDEWWQILQSSRNKLGRRLYLKRQYLEARAVQNGETTDYQKVMNFDDLSLSVLEAHELLAGYCEDFIEALSTLSLGTPP